MSDYLFAHQSLLSGFARTLDLGGTFDVYNESPSPAIADARALFSDWLAVGRDIFGAAATLGSEEGTEAQAE